MMITTLVSIAVLYSGNRSLKRKPLKLTNDWMMPIAAVILLVLVGRENDRIDAEIPAGVIVDRGSGFTTILSDGEVDYTYPSALKRRLDNVGMSAFISLFCFAVALPMLIVPKFMWFIDTLRYRMFYNWDTTPSYFALVVRKAVTYLLFAVGMIGILYGYWQFF